MNDITLYPHQEQVLKDTEGHDRVAYYLDMGLGKTFVGSEKMKQIGNDVNLLICQKSKVADWVDHFRKYYPEYKVFDATSTKRDDKRSYEYGFWMNYRCGNKVVPSVIVINYELAWRRKELQMLHDFTLILDESSMIQNEQAKRTKFILKLEPSSVILLSGTPTAGKYERLWSQVRLLGWGISKSLYYKQFVVMEYIDINGSGMMIPVVKGYRNVERLKRKLRENGAVFMKTEEAFLLPEQNDVPVLVNTTLQYRTFAKKAVVWVDNKQLIGDTTLTKRLYLRQLCGQYNEDKLSAFADLLSSTEDRLIVFYNFNAEVEELQHICEEMKRPVSIINGSTKDLTAYETEDNSVVLVQYQAGSMGLNLQKSNKVVYFTLPERSELFEQSKKRIHRIGQSRPCFYYYLLCRDSIELHIRDTLKMRKDYTDELFKEKFGQV